ncbi:putative integral membrane protein [Acanthocheilonema viteae]|uniref:Uncharacterized protein n=1 Tax=Acanthocheilonema viteae TaxID=6277 RepID=A0A498SA68_ACAVI|nr:unnamed protein product [Acanthocheilonema viteae]
MEFGFRKKLWSRSTWCTPPFIAVYLIIGNAALIIAIIIVAIHLRREVNYRSEKEFLLQLQRVYDTAIYSLFGVLIFYIITNLISLGIRLKVTKENVDYITQQVNQQRKEYEETARRFACDAFFVRKYYENGPGTFQSAEVLSVQQGVSKYKEMKKEYAVDKTIGEISKHLTMLNKMKNVMDQPMEKQFDSKFVKLIKELNRAGQVTVRKGVSRIMQDRQPLRTQEELSEIPTGSQMEGYADLTQYSVKGQKSVMMAEKTQLSTVNTTIDQINETKSEHEESVLSQLQLTSKNRKSQKTSSKTASKILRIPETEKTQSSSYGETQGNIHQLSVGSESDVKVLSEPSKNTPSNTESN